MPLRVRDLVPRTRGVSPRSHRRDPRRALIGAIVCSVVLLAASCGKGVEKIVTLTFSNERPDAVTITTSTELGDAPKGSADAAVIDAERQALLTNSDEWSIRFENAEPESERTTVDRVKRQLRKVERSGVIPVANLQRFFFDTPLSVNVIHGDGWNELTILAGTPTRATRQQKDQVGELLAKFSTRAVRYFAATHAMYEYLDSNNARSEALFNGVGTLLSSQGDKQAEIPPDMQLSDNEEKLVSAVCKSIQAMLDDAEGGGTSSVDRAFDAAFNPFSAEMNVVVPGEPLEVEGFKKEKGGALKIESMGVLEAIGALEGKWVSPDLIGGLLRADESDEAKARFPGLMARQKRYAADVVRSDDVRDALLAMMKPAERYRVRWLVMTPRKRTSS